MTIKSLGQCKMGKQFHSRPFGKDVNTLDCISKPLEKHEKGKKTKQNKGFELYEYDSINLELKGLSHSPKNFYINGTSIT